MKYIELLQKYKKLGCEYEAILFLVTEISGITKSEVYLRLNDEIPEDIFIKINDAISKYINEEIPVQYIIGYTYFYGLKIFVDESVLIPRPETEEVVERVIKEAQKYKNPKIVDIGTGSGCIAIALKKNIKNASVFAIDISKSAIEVARKNASFNQVDITFWENDLLSGIGEKFDIIVSNPPYIDPEEDVMPLVLKNEPHIALFSKNKGLYHYEKILESAKDNLNKNGVIIFEIAYNKKDEIENLAKKYSFQNISTYQDLNQKNRIVVIK
ncbi:MAG TPA: peptide chain release factor N(5)-glutamine methyltransferase [Acholeplasmataceae bacterium]|nr:peptide chain release factor N(5)-glutamine methyltransferase [Acholeplasmataceae bacterium]